MPITGSSEVTTNPNAPDTGSTTPGAIVPSQALILSNGNTLLGWTNSSGLPTRMMLQLFDPAGNALGAAFTIPADLGNSTGFVSAVATADGGFFVQRSISGEVLDYLHFDSTGGVVGQSPITASFGDGGFEMTALPGGGLAVFGIALFEVPQGDGTSWFVEKPVLRLLDAAGNQTGQTVIDGTVNNSGNVPLHAEITVLPGGNIVATWVEPLLMEYDIPSLHAQVFSATGAPVTAAFTVDSDSGSFGGFTTSLVAPVVEAFADGSYVMVWNDVHGTAFQLFNADGTAQGPKATLTTELAGYQAEYAHDVVALSDGTFVIGGFAGGSANPAGYEVVARQFNRDGTPVGDWIPVNSTVSGDQGRLDLVTTPGGGFTAVWLDHGEAFDPWNGSVDTVLDVWRQRSFSTGTPPANHAPVAQDGAASGSEDVTIAGQVAATDADGNALTYSLVTGPAHGTITFNADGSYTYTPGTDYNGADSFTFRASDGITNSNVASVALAIAAVNDAPVLAAPISDATTDEDAAFSFTLPGGTFTDVDGDALTLSASGLPSWLSFDPATRTFSGTPANGDVGTFNVTVTASDGDFSASDVFAITVANSNDAPTVAVAIVDQAATQNAAFTFALPAGTFADADAGDSLTLSTSALPAWLSFDPASRTFSGTPGAGDTGLVAVTVTATDRAGAAVSDTFQINVASGGTPPILGTGGNNVLVGTGNADTIFALGGDDAVFGMGGDDTIDGGNGNDFLMGGGGNDRVLGDAGNDLLFGGDGNDSLLGGTGNDQLWGGNGADLLQGDAGNDRLDGGTGADRLTGGAGADRLEGGSGADVFVYASVLDSAPGGGNRDQIVDFTRGVDKIDLGAIDANTALGGDQAFAYIGNAAFSGTAGQLRFVGGIVSGDVNGDGIADFQIQLQFAGGGGPLAASDFFL